MDGSATHRGVVGAGRRTTHASMHMHMHAPMHDGADGDGGQTKSRHCRCIQPWATDSSALHMPPTDDRPALVTCVCVRASKDRRICRFLPVVGSNQLINLSIPRSNKAVDKQAILLIKWVSKFGIMITCAALKRNTNAAFVDGDGQGRPH
jgi:hypothetical protein